MAQRTLFTLFKSVGRIFSPFPGSPSSVPPASGVMVLSLDLSLSLTF